MNNDESYDAYKIFDAVISGSAVSYTIDSDATGASAVWALIKGTENSTTHVWTNATYGLVFTPTANDATVYVVDGSGMDETKAAALAAYLKTYIASISAAKVGTIDKNTTSLSVGAGYYFVDSSQLWQNKPSPIPVSVSCWHGDIYKMKGLIVYAKSKSNAGFYL